MPQAPAYPMVPGPYPPYAPPAPQSGKATAVLVLGILSLVFIWCYGVPGLVMAIVALALAPGGRREIAAAGGRLRGDGSIKAGVICSWISVGLSAVGLVILVIGIIFSLVSSY